MKDFLLKIIKGLKQKDVLKSEEELLQKLTFQKAVKIKMGEIKLDSKYRIGVVDIAKNGTGYLDAYGHESAKDLMIEGHDLNSASKGDIVLAKRIFSKGSHPKAKVIEILKKEFAVSIVYLETIGDMVVAKNIKTGLPTVVAASQKALKMLPKGTVLKVDNYTSMILENLGVLSDPKVDEKISLGIYNKTEFFSDECEREAKSYGDSVDKDMYPQREDLTHLAFCTIDPPDAKDFDDAIYFDVEKNTLYVAIADVSEYVNENTCIDKEAKNRGFSIYFPHKSIPMLPRTLSENICSLKPLEDRLAFIYKIVLDPKSLEPIREELINGLINSKRRYTYDQIDAFLDGDFSQKDEVDDKILKFLLPLQKILLKVKAKRLSNGCEFSSDEVRMTLDKDQNLISTKVEHETPSHGLIEDAMLLANKAAAKSFEKGIFRIHERPSVERIDELMDSLAEIGIYSEVSDNVYKTIRDLQKKADELDLRSEVDRLIIRAQKQAIYYHESSFGHFGLGFDKYTHFTSPIRRYSDLVVHRLLKAMKKNDEKLIKYILANVEVIAMRVSELERESAKVAWDYADRKYARWALENIGEVFEATVTDVSSMPFATIEGEIFGARVFLMDSEVALFEKVKVEILESSITATKIIGRVVERAIDV